MYKHCINLRITTNDKPQNKYKFENILTLYQKKGDIFILILEKFYQKKYTNYYRIYRSSFDRYFLYVIIKLWYVFNNYGKSMNFC